MTVRLATEGDFTGLLELQARNLYANLSDSERQNGFVTTPFTKTQLASLLDKEGLFVLTKNHAIAGYTMAADWQYFSAWPIFPFMIKRLEGTSFNGTHIRFCNTFQYGPICISAHLRGSNAFPQLFEGMRKSFADRFPIGITFINQVNKRSYRAHIRKLNMTLVDRFEFSGQNYFSLAFDTSKSVLTSTKN